MSETTVNEAHARVLRGVIPIPVTTFDRSGALDLAGLRSQVEFSLEHGADGILYPGVVSEFYTLTDSERRNAVEAVVTAAGGQVPVAVGVTGASTQAAVEFTRHAAELEAQAVMTMVPYVQHFFGPSKDFALEHTRRVADVGVPVIMQNARVGFPLGATALAEVVDAVPGVRYVKEESNPPTHGISQVVKSVGETIEGVFGGIGGVYLVNELERGAIGSRGESRLQPCEHLPRRHAITDGWQHVRHESSCSWRRDNRFTSGKRMDGGWCAHRRADFTLSHHRGRKWVGPLLLLQVRNGCGVV